MSIMLMIRFQRIGRRNDPAFRIVVLDKTSGPKAGKYVELVGTYNPRTKVATLKQDAIKGWMAKGAQVSDSLHNLLVKEGVIEGAKTSAVVSKTNLEKNIAKKKAEEAAALKAEEEAKKAEADAKAKAEEEAKKSEEATPEAPTETPAEETAPTAEAPVEEEAQAPEELPAQTEEVPAEPTA